MHGVYQCALLKCLMERMYTHIICTEMAKSLFFNACRSVKSNWGVSNLCLMETASVDAIVQISS